ncbi:unnamed protein product [Prorocentrum cordatum]|uniref:RRM domain-containing protein n=1 Tax=Prorocentrum cordatum TaxID=2364126 RepID=A0ABN9SMP4_9DINO|nr:unnamed protein product [Polarella glacialis]
MAAAAPQQQAGRGLAERRCERTSRRTRTWPLAAGHGPFPEPDEATMCPSRCASKETVTADQELSTASSAATADCSSSSEGGPKHGVGACSFSSVGNTDSEGSDYDSSSGASCVVKNANWADWTDLELRPDVGRGGQVTRGTGVLQQRADKSELQAWTRAICEEPAEAAPPMHARKYAVPNSRCRAAWAPQQSQPLTASPQLLIPNRRVSSSSADARSDGGASPMGDGTNRSAGGRPTKGKAAGIIPQPGKVTTLMVRNLPPTLKQHDFVLELNATGFEDTFDICYIPRDFSSGLCKGYAFVNFKQAADASRFRATWHRTERFGCHEQLVDVSPAHTQGYEANAAKAKCAHVAKVRNPDFRALIISKDQAADPPSPVGSPCSAELGRPTRAPPGPAISLSPAALSTPLGRGATPLPGNSREAPCPEAGDRVVGFARPAPQELLGTRSAFPAPPHLQHHLPQRPLATSPAIVPHLVPAGVSVMVVMLVGSPQHSMFQESPAIQMTSTPNYSSSAAR